MIERSVKTARSDGSTITSPAVGTVGAAEGRGEAVALGEGRAVGGGVGDRVGDGLGLGLGLGLGDGDGVGAAVGVGDPVGAADPVGVEPMLGNAATPVPDASGARVAVDVGSVEPPGKMPATAARTTIASVATISPAIQSRPPVEGATRRSWPRGIVPLRCVLGVERA